ncbi:sugar phosphate isomerase/epimerase [Chitinophaga polysaccharea]|uniref:Sugar phosphate isomerase/epimerase n=1 Tax=Chitinophaga polysaccharea TaxID=1293035 RepID=A0A561PU80_9BACT|nr:TIM barrel protein [Chitinophaga polysaccharea]TWF41666.1 sugar phosphate isomerase/epimerase [Chitinophaga polysaccharea]
MQISRRNFLLKGSLAIAGTALLPKSLLAAAASKPILGIQLYSIREDMKKDPAGTLKQLATMGYKYVEHAGYSNRKFYGYSATEFKKRLGDLGLSMPSGHTVMRKDHWDTAKKDFTDEWKQTVEDAATVGQHFVISPWLDESLRKNYDDFKAYMDVFNKSGALCKRSGMKFGYHNHDFEFSQQLNGQKIFDLILTSTDPALVAQQLDIGNMYHAGGIALDIIKKYPGRFELMHVKDEIKSAKGEMGSSYESTVLGKGVIPVKEVIDLGKQSGGTCYFIIEQESYQGQAPLDAVKVDLQIMKKWGY